LLTQPSATAWKNRIKQSQSWNQEIQNGNGKGEKNKERAARAYQVSAEPVKRNLAEQARQFKDGTTYCTNGGNAKLAEDINAYTSFCKSFDSMIEFANYAKTGTSNDKGNEKNFEKWLKACACDPCCSCKESENQGNEKCCGGRKGNCI